jgi:uncharacterized protein (DUF1015 family)
VPRISPFVGLRFDPERTGPLERVTAPPYDVISRAEHERLLAASEYNVIRLDLGDRPGETGTDREAVASRTLTAWREDGILVHTDGPILAPYEMRFRLHGRPRRVRGVVCAVDLEDWGGRIFPHERTMPGPVEDRLRLLRALRTNLSCIQSIYAGPGRAIATWLDGATAGPPAAAVIDDDGVEHRLWLVPPDAEVTRHLGERELMIADGHHRYTTALRYRDEMRKAHGPGPWDAVMMLLVDAALEQPPVLPFHRIRLAGSVEHVGTRVRDLEEVLESIADVDVTYGLVTREDGALVHRVAALTGDPPVVCRLHEAVLTEGTDDLRFTPDAVEAEDAVRRGTAVASYFLPATTAGAIERVIARGDRLPEKSTFFWPKPRTGLVLRPHDAGA